MGLEQGLNARVRVGKGNLSLNSLPNTQGGLGQGLKAKLGIQKALTPCLTPLGLGQGVKGKSMGRKGEPQP